MTTEEKARAYDEALKRARANYKADKEMGFLENCDMLELIFPELAESEDERIREELVNFLQSPFIKENLTDEKVAPWIVYLEKQKEQIPYIDFVIKPHKGDDNNPYDMRVSEAQEYAIKRGFGVPFNDSEVYVDERHLTQTIGNILRWADEHPVEQKPAEPSDGELVRHPPIAYTYPSDASRDEQLKMALLALLNSDLIKVAGNKFTKQDLIDWVEKQKEQKPEGVQGDKGYPGLPGIEAVEGVVHHVMNAHYIATNEKQLNARLREIPEGAKVNIFICKAKEEGK